MKKGLIVCLFTALMCMLFAGTSAIAEVALIENDTNAELNGDIIVAYYSRNGELLHTEIEKDVKLIKDDTYSLSLSRKDYSGAASAKLMYVDDTENLIPLVKSDEVDLSANYAIISRAYLNSNTDEGKVVIYDKTAAKKTFTVADTFKVNDEVISDFEYDFVNKYGLDVVADDSNIVSRGCEYELNSRGELKSIKFILEVESTGEYTKKYNKIGTVKFDDATAMIAVDGTEFNSVNSSILVNDTTYTVTGFDKNNGTYGLIIITDGIGRYTMYTRFSVVDKVERGYNSNGEECDKLYVYTLDSKESEVVYTDDTDVVYGHLQKGDVIIYSVNLDGIIEDRADVEVLFSVGNEYTDYARDVSPNKWDDIVNDEYLNHIYDYIYENAYYVFGPVIDKTQHDITIGNVYELEDGSIVTATENVDDMRITDLDYSSDISIYICDFNEADRNRIFARTKADIEKMNIRKSFMKKDSNGEFTLIDWNNENTPKGVYALARILDDEIMDIFVIIPPADVLIKN